ncbi:hypothetical protein AAII07_35245 [Microvirga sp. 0TCS3.31]
MECSFTPAEGLAFHPVLPGQGIDSVRPIGDDIRWRVDALVADLR